jgi:chromosomal replication initiation ATPase DnaA
LESLGEQASSDGEGLSKVYADGQNLGHDENYCQVVDQRFLGDEKFIQKTLERAPQAEIRPGGRRLGFEKLLHAVAKVYGSGAKDLTATGRQRAWTKPRAQLAYLSRA